MNGPMISTILKARRDALNKAVEGIKVVAFSLECGIGESALHRMRSGRIKISDLHWNRICAACDALGITMMQLP